MPSEADKAAQVPYQDHVVCKCDEIDIAWYMKLMAVYKEIRILCTK